ncbi:MAG: acetyl-CoA hydrolase/transferase C-terminal domain-containing protein [Spongiibacteraceae bacterium]
MTKPKRILIGEGSAEPTQGFELVRQHFAPHPVEFYFGVRRSTEGLDMIDSSDISIVANFPGRGMAKLNNPPKLCNLSAYSITRALDSHRLQPDALLVVATPPDKNGDRSLGTANGPLQSAIDNAPIIFVEEYPELSCIPGAAIIPASKTIKVLAHKPAAFTALSRPPTDMDYACAENIASLLGNNLPMQIGVGGIIEALTGFLTKKSGLRIITGAVGETIRQLDQAGALDKNQNILGTALVGNEELIEWATQSKNLQLMSSRLIHNPKWLAKIANFHSINIALSIDLEGNVNAESVKDKRVSGKGGSPDFAKGAHLSPGGQAIVALRSDRGNCLVNKISRPTIPGNQISHVVTEKGIADLRNLTASKRAAALENLMGLS